MFDPSTKNVLPPVAGPMLIGKLLMTGVELMPAETNAPPGLAISNCESQATPGGIANWICVEDCTVNGTNVAPTRPTIPEKKLLPATVTVCSGVGEGGVIEVITGTGNGRRRK